MGARFVTVAMGVLTALLALVAATGRVGASIAVVVAVGCLLLALLGHERTAIAVMGLAFATAPMYRGLLPDLPASPTDLLLVVAVVLLAPELLKRQVRLPPLFIIAVGVLLVLGLRGAAVNPTPVASIVVLVQWMVVLAVFPIVIAVWRPRPAVVSFLLWCYLAGHMASTAVGLLEGPLSNDRYLGLANHPNSFGTAGAVAVAVVFYLWTKHPDRRARVILTGILLASGASILMSGSRAATVVVVALVLLVPAVERSALLAASVAGVGAAVLAFSPVLLGVTGEGSSLTRLVGDSTARASDSVRDDAIEKGTELFHSAPLLGSGMSFDLVEVHNLYLEVAIAVGLLGLIAYLAVLYVLARPLLGDHPERRLCYFTWVFAIIGPVVPGLTDRSMLLPMGLAILAAVAPRPDDQAGTRAESDLRTTGRGASRAVA